jgi:hypothetical protein
MLRKKIRLRRRIILALAVACAVVPSAQAGVDRGLGVPAYDDRPSVAEVLYDVDRAIAALDGEQVALALERKADVFVPQPRAGDDSGWAELGAGAGIGAAAALFGAALAFGLSRRRGQLARA